MHFSEFSDLRLYCCELRSEILNNRIYLRMKTLKIALPNSCKHCRMSAVSFRDRISSSKGDTIRKGIIPIGIRSGIIRHDGIVSWWCSIMRRPLTLVIDIDHFIEHDRRVVTSVVFWWLVSSRWWWLPTPEIIRKGSLRSSRSSRADIRYRTRHRY